MSKDIKPDLPDGATKSISYLLHQDYVKDWTVDRALVELIANALDEDPQAEASWADGVFTIEDNGPGIPQEGFYLGASEKDKEQVGQFGEGKKLASLVLSRDPRVGAIRFETVGYDFTPTIEPTTLLDGIVPRRGTNPPASLVYHFTPSASGRTQGTRITVECPREVADEAISRIRPLAEPAYTRPQETAEILLDREPGIVYVGGIMVNRDTRLSASYDLPLSTAKSEQNRDRTIVDGRALEDHIRTALALSKDPQVIAHFVERALNGPKLAQAETYFSLVHGFAVRQAYRLHATTLWNERQPPYYNPDSRAHSDQMALERNGATLVTSTLGSEQQAHLMELLGVRPVRRAREHFERTRPPIAWVARRDLSMERRRVMDQATAAFYAVWGPGTLGTVRAYDDTKRQVGCAADGYYVALNDTTGINLTVLDDLAYCRAVLFHEGAHRRAATQGKTESPRV